MRELKQLIDATVAVALAKKMLLLEGPGSHAQPRTERHQVEPPRRILFRIVNGKVPPLESADSVSPCH